MSFKEPVTHRVTLALRRLQRDSHDQCSECGHAFAEGDTAHAGFLRDGNPAYVGDCCAGRLAETGARYYWMRRSYESPPPDALLWRYLDLAKFIALLKDKAVHFTRADRLGDPFEGAKGSVQLKAYWESFYTARFRSSILNPPEGIDCNLSPTEVEAEAQRLVKDLGRGGTLERESTFVSCWHESEHESEALWAKYGGHGSLALAIRTTTERLNKSLGDDPSIDIGRIEYLDFKTQFAGINKAFFRKRRSFQHEREVRAVIRIYDDPPTHGHLMPVDLQLLLESVIVSPLAPTWFNEVVREVLLRFDCVVKLQDSELRDSPFF